MTYCTSCHAVKSTSALPSVTEGQTAVLTCTETHTLSNKLCRATPQLDRSTSLSAAQSTALHPTYNTGVRSRYW